MSATPLVENDNRPGPDCPFEIARPVMDHRWLDLTFLHWRYPVEVVQAVLPPGLVVESFDGDAWVGLVPFEMQVTLPGRGPLPWISRFPETNVRTYVRAGDGTTGVWFLSLDATRLPAVVTARTTYRLPYFWSDMSVTFSVAPTGRTHVDYTTVRRWPGPRGARSDIGIDVGDAYRADELSDLDHWMTARFRLYSARRTGISTARAEHAPWPLHRAVVTRLDDELITAAGLPAPTGAPVVHWSPGVDVRVSLPERLWPAVSQQPLDVGGSLG
jgi:uncharacterized protein YqjF (DUF2071 family)